MIPALDLMKTDSAYHFGMEQALNLKELIEEHPERKDEVITRYKEGRFTWGATYNQPYDGMHMGEQLIREVYFGKKWIKDNFEGSDAKTAFNTDVPGIALQFPQVLAKSGGLKDIVTGVNKNTGEDIVKTERITEAISRVIRDAKDKKTNDAITVKFISSDNNLSWEQAKKKEKKRDSVLDGVPLSLPTLTRARRIQEKASSVGFDWIEIKPIWSKVHEEISELSEAITFEQKDKIQDEMGDVLFSVVNLARFLDIDPEASLRQTIRKFESRFKKVEKSFENSEQMSKASLDQMDKIWNQAKEEE